MLVQLNFIQLERYTNICIYNKAKIIINVVLKIKQHFKGKLNPITFQTNSRKEIKL